MQSSRTAFSFPLTISSQCLLITRVLWLSRAVPALRDVEIVRPTQIFVCVRRRQIWPPNLAMRCITSRRYSPTPVAVISDAAHFPSLAAMPRNVVRCILWQKVTDSHR